MTSPSSWLLLVIVAAAGCGPSDDTGGEDGGPAGDGSSGVTVPSWLDVGAPPVAPPVLTPCPDGWREVPGEPATCEPYGEAGRDTCAASDEVHLPGEPGCRRIGPACPADGLPADLPADRAVIYVQTGAPAGGDGTRAAPYASPLELAIGPLRNTIIALGVGRYDHLWRLPATLALWGACVAETILTTSTGDTAARDAVVEVVGSGAELVNVSVVDALRVGVIVSGRGVEGHLRSVLVERTSEVGVAVLAPDSLVTATELVVRDVPGQIGGLGAGLFAGSGARAEVRSSLFERNQHHGIWVDDSSLLLEDVAIVDSVGREIFGLFGRGLEVSRGATAEVHRTYFDSNRGSGIFVWAGGATLRIDDTVIRGTRPYGDGGEGRGLSVGQDTDTEARRLLIDGNHESGMFFSEVGAHVRVEDSVVRDTQPQASTLDSGRGITVQDGPSAEIVRVVLERNQDVGIVTWGSELLLEDIATRGTMPSAGSRTGGGSLYVYEGAQVTGARLLFEGGHEVGVLASDEGTLVDLSDLAVLDIDERACAADTCADSSFGNALAAYRAGRLRTRGFLLRNAALCGAHLAGRSEVDLIDGVVEGCQIGACVQNPTFDVERLGDRVQYRENDVNLDSTSLPVPEPSNRGRTEGGT